MFTQSEQVNDLFAALSKAQGEFDHAKKDVKNDFYKSKYADLASCIDAAKDHLAKHGLLVTQPTYINETSETVLVTILGHSSGQWIKGEYPLRPVKVDPQGYGSALSYARRYCFCAITGLAADDDDGNAASNNKAEQPKTEQPKTEQPKVNYIAKLKAAKDLEEVGKVWASIPNDLKPIYISVKDEMKQKFSNNKESGYE